jgi:hypothetical protein
MVEPIMLANLPSGGTMVAKARVHSKFSFSVMIQKKEYIFYSETIP